MLAIILMVNITSNFYIRENNFYVGKSRINMGDNFRATAIWF